jgi:PAS domain S-box-containing protein
MDFQFFDDVWKKPTLIPGFILACSSAILILNIYGLEHGITYVFPHLFYIPIIVTAYYYPRRGVLFAVFLSACYFAASLMVVTPTLVEIISALARCSVFVVIAWVVSYLSGRMHHDTQMCRRLVSVVKFSIDAIVGEDTQGIITDWNSGAERLYGYKPAEMIGTPTECLIPRELMEEKHLLIRKVRQGEVVERFETERITKDGSRIHVSLSLSPIFNNAGEFIGVSNIAHDISERKRAEESLRQSEIKFHTMADFTVDWEYWLSPENGFVYNSPSCEIITGYSAEEFAGDPDLPLKIVHPDNRDDYTEHIRTIHAYADEGHLDFRIIKKNGEIRWIGHSCRPVYGRDGVYLGRRASNRDITERKQLEESLRMANKKLNLLSSITRHDIRNQLMALNAYIQLSDEVLDDPEMLREYLSKEQQIADSIAHQISFTKDYEDLGVTSPAWQDVDALISNATASLPIRDIAFEIHCSGLEVYADPLLEKVFYNLIDNSLHYGGECMTRVGVTAETCDDCLHIVFEDNGNGISIGDKMHLFTKGFGKHTGLGLFLSREILSITGITITENGVPGMGARFEIVVPRNGFRFSERYPPDQQR